MTDAILYDTAGLDDLDDDAFRTLIASRMSTIPGNNQLWTTLCDADLIDRTAGCLDEMAELLAEIVTSRQLPRDHPTTRRLNLINNRRSMVDARANRIAGHQAARADMASNLFAVLRDLTLAVNEHRLACIAANLSPEPHDLTLWAQLDELQLPNAGDPEQAVTLAERVTSGHWYRAEAVSVD